MQITPLLSLSSLAGIVIETICTSRPPPVYPAVAGKSCSSKMDGGRKLLPVVMASIGFVRTAKNVLPTFALTGKTA